MNWLSIIILLIPVFYALKGFQKGMVRMAVSFLSVFVTLIICFFLNPYVEKMLKQETKIYESIQKECENYITNIVEGQEDEEINIEEKAILQKLPLPESIIELFSFEPSSEEYGDYLMESFIKSLAGSIAKIVVRAVSLFLTFFLISVIMKVIGKILMTIFSFPILSMANRLGGAVLGVGKGICIVWIFFLLIMVFWNSNWVQNFYYLIKENFITDYLYNHNMFLYFLNSFK